MLLSKRQFKAGVERLRAQLVPSSLFTMISKALEKSSSPLTSEESSLLSGIEKRIGSDVQLLDRRRAEGFLSNALYAQPYSRVAHKMLPDKKLPKIISEWESMSEHYRMYGVLLGRLNPHYVGTTADMKVVLSYVYERLLSTPMDNFSVYAKGTEQVMCDDLFRRSSVDYNAIRFEFSDLRIDMEAVYATSLDDGMYGRDYEGTSRVAINGVSISDFSKSLGVMLDGEEESELYDSFMYVLTNGFPVGDIFDRHFGFGFNDKRIEDTDFAFKLSSMTAEEFSSIAVKGWMLFYYACKLVDGLDEVSVELSGVEVDASGFDRVIDGEYLRCGTLIYRINGVELKIIVNFAVWADVGFEPKDLEVQFDGKIVYAVEGVHKVDGEYPGESLLEHMGYDLFYLFALSEASSS